MRKYDYFVSKPNLRKCIDLSSNDIKNNIQNLQTQTNILLPDVTFDLLID